MNPDQMPRPFNPPHSAPDRKEEFREELRALLNRFSMESEGGDTSDFILADYLIECLRTLDMTITKRNLHNCLPASGREQQ